MVVAREEFGNTGGDGGVRMRSVVRIRGRDEHLARRARPTTCSSAASVFAFEFSGNRQDVASDPSVTSPLWAAKAARTSSFSRGGTPK